MDAAERAGRPWSAATVGLLEMSRPGNVAMAAMGVAIGALVAAGPQALGIDVALTALATALVTAGGNLLNDVTDQRIDQAAHPERPLPSGRVSRRQASVATGLAAGLALVLAAMVSVPILLLVLAAEVGLAGYERWLKASGLAGNLVVAGLVALTFIAGGLAVGALTSSVAFLSGSALLANVAREIWKDIEDAPHDEGRTTLAVAWGPERAHRLAKAATWGAILISPLPYLVGFGGLVFLGTVLAADLVFLAALLQAEASQAQRFSKAGMLTALAAFTLGAIA